MSPHLLLHLANCLTARANGSELEYRCADYPKWTPLEDNLATITYLIMGTNEEGHEMRVKEPDLLPPPGCVLMDDKDKHGQWIVGAWWLNRGRWLPPSQAMMEDGLGWYAESTDIIAIPVKQTTEQQ